MRFGRQRLDLVTMSGRELQRIEVFSEVLARRRSEISAAAILGLSTRQTRRLLAALSRWWRRSADSQGSWPHLEQPAYSWHPRVCDRTGSVQTRGVNLAHHTDRRQIVRSHHGRPRLAQLTTKTPRSSPSSSPKPSAKRHNSHPERAAPNSFRRALGELQAPRL